MFSNAGNPVLQCKSYLCEHPVLFNTNCYEVLLLKRMTLVEQQIKKDSCATIITVKQVLLKQSTVTPLHRAQQFEHFSA